MTVIVTAKLRQMPLWDDRERATLVALLQERPQAASWPGAAAEIIEAGSARSVRDARHEQSLFDTETPAPIAQTARQIAGWRAAGLGVHTFRDVSYPAQLREIHQVPPVLFSRGTLRPGEPAVSVVGSRRASTHSVDWASEVSAALVSAGITVVSGLAAGIDTAAHTAAVDAGGHIVAVLGTGINRVYPAANRDLQERIACVGLVLSQFWPDALGTKKSFLLRTATMCGYGRATIVIEAGETSGARIQARIGVEHGRAVILHEGVVRANEWAAALQRRPGVHVVSGVDEALCVGVQPNRLTIVTSQIAHVNFKAEFFSKLASRGIRQRFVHFNHAAGHIPIRLVLGIDQEYPAVLITQQHINAGTFAGLLGVAFGKVGVPCLGIITFIERTFRTHWGIS